MLLCAAWIFARWISPAGRDKQARCGRVRSIEGIDDPICMDGGGRARYEVHMQLIETTVAAFRRALSSPD